jgi:very-short-patch-repair endonuclease
MSIERARELRRNMSPAENRLWQLLRGKRVGGLKFRRQSPIGPYIAGFYCPKAGLVVELDDANRTSIQDIEEDEKRTRWFEARGIRLLRVSTREFLRRPDDLIYAVHKAAKVPFASSTNGFEEGAARYT